jgi:thioredoxin reductase
MTGKDFDVIIIGGSYAGLSAAMSLGRSLRQILIIDSGLPCNRQTPLSHNFITQDGEQPAAIAAKARAQVLAYPTVSFVNDFALSGNKTKNGFTIITDSGNEFNTKKLIFATGIKDLLPDINGLAACWGISVVHCPYCHGYELRKQQTGIIANGERAFHLASLVNNLTDEITFLTNGKADFTEEQGVKFEKHHLQIIEAEINEIEQENGQVRSVIFSNGSRKSFQALYLAAPFVQHSDIPADLGCELTEQGYIKVNGMQKTTIEGVFACGDNSSMMRSVANAAATGNLTGAMVNKELTDESF